jgi:hypothetical protein
MLVNLSVTHRGEMPVPLAAYLAAQYVAQRNRVRPEAENHVRKPVDRSAAVSPDQDHSKATDGR